MTTTAINRQRLLDRFLSYVSVDTAADPAAGPNQYPSSAGQWELGRLLTQQLTEMSADYPHQDDRGLVWATVPATDGGQGPAVALIAHLDTSPEAPSHNVQPQVIQHYEGGDIRLPSGQVIRVDQTPELKHLVGSTLITTDGNTLLGGDDKAGVAIIMELAHHLLENPHLVHGPVRILFTCDEEIGRGTDYIDLDKLNAVVGYTLDGGDAGQLDVETFSADAASVILRGHNIHPAIAKGRMINAVRAAADFLAGLPMRESPETTEDRQGFIHPYNISGGVGEAKVELILRSFETPELQRYAEVIRQCAQQTQQKFPGLEVEVNVRRQYRNLAEGLEKLPEAAALAEQAYQNLGHSCQRTIVRGGTDGSQLTEKGLPTPNLSSGQHNIHAVHEFACLDQMVAATEHLVELLRLWSERGRS
ncbi:peptidase T [Roseimaritima sediminicola]|uniref:peptidase T n=1 Tax=Roseimaritima sediminicola TaxID=2662066 RepID=UPI0012985772|nr:peptidase T [Roseimaritima sediminicola]